MTNLFKNIDEAKDYFKHYNFSNWLRDTFEISVKENGIEKITFSLQGGVATVREINVFGWSRHIGSYGVEDANSLITVLREIVDNPYN